MPRIVIIAGEASGDQLGAGLIREALRQNPDTVFEGIAGPAMIAAGCDSWADSEELAVMGLFEVLRHLPRLRRLMKGLETRILKDPPDLFIGIDAPDFNLRLERRLRSSGIRTVHYVSPSVWAWRPGRVKVLRAACDMVLCLLPFEAEFLQDNGIPARFVGHPLADEIGDDSNRSEARRALGIEAETVIGLLPGSRLAEVERLGPPFAKAAEWLSARVDDIRFVVPTVSASTRRVFERCWDAHGPQRELVVLDGQAREAMRASDALLLASGTATLEAMLVGRPMVVAYRVSPISLAIVKALRLIRVQYFSLPNLLAGQRLVPEYLQGEVTGPALGQALLELIEAPDRSAPLLEQFREQGARLRRSASHEAAKTVLGMAAPGPVS